MVFALTTSESGSVCIGWHKIVALVALRQRGHLFHLAVIYLTLALAEGIGSVVIVGVLVDGVGQAVDELHCDHLVLYTRVRDALVVLAALKRKLLKVTVFLLCDQLFNVIFSSHFLRVAEVDLLALGTLADSREEAAYCWRFRNVEAGDAFLDLALAHAALGHAHLDFLGAAQVKLDLVVVYSTIIALILESCIVSPVFNRVEQQLRCAACVIYSVGRLTKSRVIAEH